MVMKLFMRSKYDTPKPPAIPRLAKLDVSELSNWFNTTLMGLGMSFDKWKHHDAPDEVSIHLETLVQLWSEIKSRSEK
jgi:hypothetical protein